MVGLKQRLAGLGRPGVWALLVVCLAVAGFGARRVVLGPAVPVEEVTRSDIVQTVVASGRVVAPQRIEIGAQVSGEVVAVPVEEGQTVAEGDVLVRLREDEARAALVQAEAAVTQARERLRQVASVARDVTTQGVTQARANLVQAQKAYERTRSLFDSGFVGQSQLDDAVRNLDVARSQMRSNQTQERTNRPGGADHAAARSALAQAEAALAAAQVRLGYCVIRAPRAGTLIARSVERGYVVQPGRTLMVLSPSGATQLVVDIDERNLGLLAVGQSALASADAYAKDRFKAKVAYINPGIDPSRGSVQVKLDVDKPPEYLRQDMTVSIDIEAARRDGTVVAPIDAVQEATGDHPWVSAVRDGRLVKLEISVGLRGDDRVEIRSGLAPGDRVVPVGVALPAYGSRVRPVPKEDHS